MSSLPSLECIPTPALLVDGPVLLDNITRMAERAATAGVELFPHSKTHKSRQIARLQQEHGAVGLTAATLREATCFADAGVDKLLLAHPPVGWKLEALSRLAARADIRVVIDGLDSLELLDACCRRTGMSVKYLWEVDCGVHRCGTEPGSATAELIAQATRRFPHAPFDGLMTFGGHSYAATDTAGIEAAAQDEKDALQATAEALEAHGIEARARSAGTTPTSHQLAERGPITEIRPGNYVFYDATQVTLGIASEHNCALSVLASVVSRPDPCRVILDSGSKALAAERLSPRSHTFGLIAGHPELAVERLFEEHAILTSKEPTDIPIGARLRVIPNHSCATANLHSRMLITDADDVIDVWTIDARGWDVPSAVPASAAEVAV